MKRYVMSRSKGKVLCLPANHPTRRAGANLRQQAEPGPAPHRPFVNGEEVVGWIVDNKEVQR